MIKILYVEDEAFLAKIVKESLENRQFEVHHVSDGADVMPAFVNFQPDICVLDVMLPSVDGFTLAKQIRTQFPNLPIIFLTAKDQTHDVVQGFEIGGNDYLRKPFSMEELIVRIKNLVKIKTQNIDNETINNKEARLGKYIFSPLTYELKLDNHHRRLSYRETELLKMLYEYRNRSLDRKHVLLTLWGDDSYFNSRNLDVYIRKLRDYLAQDNSVEIITLKGVGYHFSI